MTGLPGSFYKLCAPSLGQAMLLLGLAAQSLRVLAPSVVNFPPEALCEVEEIQPPEKEKAVTLVML